MFKEKNTLKAWLVCLTCALFFFYDFIQFMMSNSLSHILMDKYNVNASNYANFNFMFLATDVLFLFPAGIIIGRFSVKKITLITLLLSVLGALGVALFDDFSMVLAARAVAGIAHAFCFLCCIAFVNAWFSSKYQAKVIGIIITIAMLGGVVAQNPMLMSINAFGLDNTLYINVLVGALIWVLSFMVLKDCPREDQGKVKLLNFNGSEFVLELKTVFSNSQNWFYGIYTGCLNMPIMVICAMWGVKYLTTTYMISEYQAGGIVSIALFGNMLGSPLMGAISDFFQKRRLPSIVGAVLTFMLTMIVIFDQSHSVFMLYVLFFSIGVFSGAQVISYPGINESNPSQLSSTAMGLAAVLIMGLGSLGQKISGILLDVTWQGEFLNQVRFYDANSFKNALLVVPISLLFAILAAYMTKETNCEKL